jgi:hypothetical protein
MFKQWVRNWLNSGNQLDTLRGNEVVCETRLSSPSKEGLNFTLYAAVGGHVLETRVYDSRTDRHIGSLYMIQEDSDFADQVAKAITCEMLKQ